MAKLTHPEKPHTGNSMRRNPALLTDSLRSGKPPFSSAGASAWQQFCEWVTSTDNRLYVGWFGVLMIPTLLAATTSSSLSSPPTVDIDGIREPSPAPCSTATSSPVLLFASNAIGLHFIPSGKLPSMVAVRRRSFPAGDLPLPHRHLCLHGPSGTLLPPACAPGSALLTCTCGCCFRVFLVYPFGQVLLTPCPWASLAPSTTCWCSRPSTTS